MQTDGNNGLWRLKTPMESEKKGLDEFFSIIHLCPTFLVPGNFPLREGWCRAFWELSNLCTSHSWENDTAYVGGQPGLPRQQWLLMLTS
ncbi:hypothetical protein COLO4_05345 [Corchorus olitorius]|uniref:Uncharacterized protein n=1 Tax=Corchorus olitorius TaxID=93759 RepID=A0A1R3KR64_9ROSI|nr:hypothetical protein COLO4_05345 [Corchorus olitorius]